jgi:IS30 family transposase
MNSAEISGALQREHAAVREEGRRHRPSSQSFSLSQAFEAVVDRMREVDGKSKLQPLRIRRRVGNVEFLNVEGRRKES